MKDDRYAIINACDWGSTGKIAVGLQRYLENNQQYSLFCYGRGLQRDGSSFYRFARGYEVVRSALLSKVTGRLSIGSKSTTRRLINRLCKEKINKVFVLNLHDHYLDEDLFFQYIAEKEIGLVYIMIDEHAYLGNCNYRNGCVNYMKGCQDCPRQKLWQKLLFPHVPEKVCEKRKHSYNKLKQAVFLGPEFVVRMADESPLLKYMETTIIDEAVDTAFYSPKETSVLREFHHIEEDKIIICCVAPLSQPAKGVRYFIEAARRMEDDSRYVFVHVGYNKNGKTGLPCNYIAVDYLKDQSMLVQYYSLADLFVFPSIQDTMPNACLEALACGSPLLCFNISGMPFLGDENVMTLVDAENVDQMVDVIKRTRRKDLKIVETCRNYALERYDSKKYYQKLVEISHAFPQI